MPWEDFTLDKLHVASLREDHLEDAASLVSVRYQALRRQVPILPARYEEVDALLAMLRGLAGEASGVVATRGRRLAGFLLGFVIPEFLGKRTVYSPEWANGALAGESRRVYEEMYALLSATWVADKCFSHVVSLLGNDREGIEGWQWLGFGMAAVDGVRELKPVEGGAEEVEIRQASLNDIGEATRLGEALEKHLAAAPTFWVHPHQDYAEWLEDPRHALWLACEDGEVIAFMGLEGGHSEGCEIVQDEKTVSISSAFTKEDARGRGVATALLNRCLAWGQSEGYERCAVDFEAMNRLAARYWMKWFEPVCYSLMRCIDERVGRSYPP